MRRVLGILVAGAFVLGACGGDDGESGGGDEATETESGGESSGEGQEFADAVSSSLQDDPDVPIEGETADCLGRAIVDTVGVDAIEAADVTPEEFADADNLSALGIEVPEDTPDRLGAAFGDCDVAADIEEALITGFSGEFGTELPEDAATCLRDELNEDDLTTALAQNFVDGTEDGLQQALGSAMGACPDVATAVLVAQAPENLPPEAETCISEFVAGNTELVAESFATGSDESGQELGNGLAAACPELAGVGGAAG